MEPPILNTPCLWDARSSETLQLVAEPLDFERHHFAVEINMRMW